MSQSWPDGWWILFQCPMANYRSLADASQFPFRFCLLLVVGTDFSDLWCLRRILFLTDGPHLFTLYISILNWETCQYLGMCGNLCSPSSVIVFPVFVPALCWDVSFIWYFSLCRCSSYLHMPFGLLCLWMKWRIVTYLWDLECSYKDLDFWKV